MKDNSSSYNQWLPCELFEAGDYEKLMDTVLALRKPSEEAERCAA